MKFSYDWLQTYFTEPLPAPAQLAERITAHSSEVEEMVSAGADTVFDIKVLPDKSSWLMSHRGLAREVSTIVGVPLATDPLQALPVLPPAVTAKLVTIASPDCDYYGAILIEGVTVGPSPAWLKTRLEAIGQRSINAVVDATNFVMFDLGQPLHVFDADLLGVGEAGLPQIEVRRALEGEVFVTLSHEERVLTAADTVVADGVSGAVLALAGVKGGLVAGVTERTTRVLVEFAHFDRVAVRKSAQRHRLATDAAKRYENGLSRAVAPYGGAACAALITELSGGQMVGFADAGTATEERAPVTVTTHHINRSVGITLSTADVRSVLARFGYEVAEQEETFVVTPPFERDDIVLSEDLVEEVARIYGLGHIVSIPPTPTPLRDINARHYYADQVRDALLPLGFSEVYTSSFRNEDTVRLKNAIASDKGCLRSRLMDNLLEARERNLPHRDLLGLRAIQLFEIGTVFAPESEAVHVGLAVQTGTTYKAKVDDALVASAVAAITAVCGPVTVLESAPGYVEFSLDAIVATLPPPVAYQPHTTLPPVAYKAFSVYPAVSRDIAMWVGEGTALAPVVSMLGAAAGPLLARVTHLDTFTKDGRTSLAFRLVFQSHEKTLDGTEVDALMQAVYAAVVAAGYEVR